MSPRQRSSLCNELLLVTGKELHIRGLWAECSSDATPDEHEHGDEAPEKACHHDVVSHDSFCVVMLILFLHVNLFVESAEGSGSQGADSKAS